MWLDNQLFTNEEVKKQHYLWYAVIRMSQGKSHTVIYFILIIIFGSIIRFWNLDTNPPGLHGDEALTGYTAYSLLKTGKDLAGKTNILSLTDTNGGGTYPSVLSWIMVPFVAVLGLHPYVDRFPSALFGVVSIIALFVIVKEVTRKDALALAAALLLAVNPWAIHISRQGLLESVSLGMVLLGTAFFLKAGAKPAYILVSSVFFGLALFSYDAPRLFLPFFIIALAVFRWRALRQSKRFSLFSLFVFLIFYTLFLHQTFFRGEIGEYSKSSILNMAKISERVNTERTLTRAPLWLSGIFHNKLTVGYKNVLTNYVGIFSLNWLFVNGSGELQQATGSHGQYHLFELPLFFIGLYYFFTKHRKVFYLFLLWIFIGALPGGFSTGVNTFRNSLVIPAPLLFSASGLLVVFSGIAKLSPGKRTVAGAALTTVIVALVTSYLFTYFFDYPVYASERWDKQKNEAILYALQRKNDYANVFFDGATSWATTYGFLVTLDPVIFQKSIAQPGYYKDTRTYRFDTLSFGLLDDAVKLLPSAADYFPKNTLVITGGDNDVFEDDTPVARFYDPGGVRSVYKALEVQ